MLKSLSRLLWITLGLSCCCGRLRSAQAEAQFQDLRPGPDAVWVVTESNRIGLQARSAGIWSAGTLCVKALSQPDGPRPQELRLELQAQGLAVKTVEVEWRVSLPANWKFLGDAWERAYGTLEWSPLDPQRVMPWYFLASNGRLTHGYGVKTGAAALCWWSVSTNGVRLHADVRSGGVGVELGSRTLSLASVVCRQGLAQESPFEAAQRFCRQMCPAPRLPREPVYGFNDWYCTYGQNTAAALFKSAEFLARLSPTNNRPFAVIDDGWQVKGERGHTPWQRTNPRFSPTLSMGEVAARLRALGVRPGIWVRPLQAYPEHPQAWRLGHNSKVLDPTVPEVRAYIQQVIGQLRGWGFELIKHDFSTVELLGLWGKDMGEQTTADGWAFARRECTTAEVLNEFYGLLRQAAGDEVLLVGCNTVGHLAAGVFELQRIGDDTSGREWQRTRSMGVNALGFRAAQHGTFFAVDADCVGQSSTGGVIPWEKNSQWLELLAQSGTPFFISFAPEVVTPEREPALRNALKAAAQAQPLGEPLDWMETRFPARWRLNGKVVQFCW